MIRRIDVHSLRLFVSAATEGSIARGAAREHIAPSALSRRIADLEQALGVPLIIRSPRGIELTAAGRLVLERSQEIDREIEGLRREALACGDEISGVVRLAANHSSIVGYLPEPLKRYIGAHPQVRVVLSEGDTDDVVQACLDDRADIGLGVNTELAERLERWFFARDPLIVVVPVNHPLVHCDVVRFSDVVQYPLIGIRKGGSLDGLLSNHRAKLLQSSPDLASDMPVQVGSFDAACRMVEAGLGIVVIPQSAARAYAGTKKFVRRPLAEDWADRKLYIYASRKSPRFPAVQALIDRLAG